MKKAKTSRHGSWADWYDPGWYSALIWRVFPGCFCGGKASDGRAELADGARAQHQLADQFAVNFQHNFISV
jgi:hypothetical protein